MHIVGVLQARLGSQRLPNKVLCDLDGKPMIQRVWDRMTQSYCLGGCIAAVPHGEEGDPLLAYLDAADIPYFAGPEHDLICRLLGAAEKTGADAIVRITADCPCVCYELINNCVRLYATTGVDYVSNVNPPTFPDGLDVEVYSVDLMRTLAGTGEWFPHAVWENNALRKVNLSVTGWPKARLTVDYPEDLVVVRAIYKELGPHFTLEALLELVNKSPSYLDANRMHMGEYPRGGKGPHDQGTTFLPTEW
jgi:glutamate-1-semialdehyde 2,1-aminomutase